jgi:predicted dehydrogenase
MSGRDGKQVSRRKLIAGAVSGAAASIAAVGAGGMGVKALGQQDRSRRSANDTLRVGVIGSGSRGPYIGYAFHSTPGVQVTALCDVYDENMAKAVKLVEGLGVKPAVHKDFRRLLDDRDIDAVIVATNVHWHALPAISACAAGKDVYLEKPVATSVAEGRAIVRAARRHDRIVGMGTQQHTWEHYREAAELIRSGRLGNISEVHVWDIARHHLGAPPDTAPPPGLDWDFWLGPAPESPYNVNRQMHHDWFFDYCGGWQLAWGVHHCDIVHMAMGAEAPVAAVASGGKWAYGDRDNREWPDTFNGVCEYPPCPAAKDGFAMTYTLRTGSDPLVEGRRNGKAFHGTEGSLVIGRDGYDLYAAGKDRGVQPEQRVKSRLKEHEVVLAHVKRFVECVRERRRPETDIEVGHRATTPGHLMNIAWRLGRRVRWDASSERFKNDAEADALLSRQYRSPWSLPAEG